MATMKWCAYSKYVPSCSIMQDSRNMLNVTHLYWSVHIRNSLTLLPISSTPRNTHLWASVRSAMPYAILIRSWRCTTLCTPARPAEAHLPGLVPLGVTSA